MIEYGDSRLSEASWQKICSMAGPDACWVWDGAFKTMKSGKRLAIIHFAKSRVTTLRKYFAEIFHDIDDETEKTVSVCENPECANPNHVKVVKKGECKAGHNAKKYANGQCSECRRLKDQAIPKEVINARARQYRESLKSRPTKARKTIRQSDYVKPTATRQGISAFGDKPPEKPWRPTGWPEEVLNGRLSA